MSDRMIAETVDILGHRGDRIPAYVARPTGRDVPLGSVIVVHHMPGLDESTREIVRRFAAEGFLAISPNLHHRYAPGASPNVASDACRAVGGVPDDQLVGDVDGARTYLLGSADSNGKVAVVGYCSGGRQAFLAGCALPIDGVVDCYGAYVVVDPPADHSLKVTSLTDRAGDLSCPLLGLFGAHDQHPSPDEAAQLEALLVSLGKDCEIHVYEDAGHAFFAVDRPNFRPEAAKDGWVRVLTFLGKVLST